jgi:hypothetical protein
MRSRVTAAMLLGAGLAWAAVSGAGDWGSVLQGIATPIDSNAAPEGKANNRRVELVKL